MSEMKFRENPERPGFVVSEDGRIFREMHQSPHSAGYRVVGYRLAPGRKSKTKVVYVHQMILETFVGPCPEGMQCRHLNGIRTDNRLVNLAWGTPVENAADRELHGTALRGEQHSHAILTEDIIKGVCFMADQGFTQAAVSEAFGIPQNRVSAIVRGKTWKHVDAPRSTEDGRKRKGVAR